MFYRNRMYSTSRGRFLQRDPIGYIDGMNLYCAYFVPLGMDPNGLEATEEVKKKCCAKCKEWIDDAKTKAREAFDGALDSTGSTGQYTDEALEKAREKALEAVEKLAEGCKRVTARATIVADYIEFEVRVGAEICKAGMRLQGRVSSICCAACLIAEGDAQHRQTRPNCSFTADAGWGRTCVCMKRDNIMWAQGPRPTSEQQRCE